MSEKKHTREDASLSIRDDDSISEKLRHPVQRFAHQILEECLKQNWNAACILTDELLHQCLGRGYFALAKTVKKLRWAMEPEVDESETRKYLLRMMWLLARAKREKNHFYLIYNDKKICQLKKRESQKRQCDHELLHREVHSLEMTARENSFSTIAQRLATDATILYVETETDAHVTLQPPHVQFFVPSEEIISQHRHVEIPKPMGERIHKKSPSAGPQTES